MLRSHEATEEVSSAIKRGKQKWSTQRCSNHRVTSDELITETVPQLAAVSGVDPGDSNGQLTKQEAQLLLGDRATRKHAKDS